MGRRLLVSLLVCCAVAGCSRTQSVASAGAAAVVPSADQKGAVQQGLRAYIDPATGQLRAPTEAELAAEAAQQNVPAAAVKIRIEPEEIHLPNGMTEVRVGKEAEVAEITCIQRDGSLGPCPPQKAAELRARDTKSAP